MSERTSGARYVVIVFLLLVVLLAGQWTAGQLYPPGDTLGTGTAVGQTTFAYLSGLRVFVAQVLWNRIEPLFHEYYGGIPLREQTYMLPTLNAINMLDPQFEQPYYIAPWILARQDDVEMAIEVAARGARDNPRSGLLLTSYAQMLALYGDDIDTAYEQARIAVGPDIEWLDDLEKHDSYGILRFVYTKYGDESGAQEILHEIEHLDELIGDRMPAGSHDHDGDGVPDH